MSRVAVKNLLKDALFYALLLYTAYSLLIETQIFQHKERLGSVTSLYTIKHVPVFHGEDYPKSSNVSVEICTLETRRNSAVDMARGLLQEYTTRQNYTLTFLKSKEELHYRPIRGDPKWLKYHVLLDRFMAKRLTQKELTSSSTWTSNHWIFWMDGDVLITNFSIKLEAFVNEWAEDSTMMLVSRDPFSENTGNTRTPINVGVLGVRFSSWSEQFLDRLVKTGPKLTKKQIGNRWSPGLIDQPAFTYLLEQTGELCDVASSKPSLHLHVAVLPLRHLQSICRWGYNDKREVLWKRGDFAAHVTGMSRAPAERERVMKLLVEFSQGSTADGLEAENVCESGFRNPSAQPVLSNRFDQEAMNLMTRAKKEAVYPNWKELFRIVQGLFKANPGQMSIEQYVEIADELRKMRPCNLLVWGAGNDIWLWAAANIQGQIAILESDRQWLKTFAGKLGESVHLLSVSFKQKVAKSADLLEHPAKVDLLVDVPSTVSETAWDIVLVDGPAGNSLDSPGRMESLYTSRVLIANIVRRWQKNVTLYIHDASRDVERTWADALFGTTYTETYGQRKIASATSLRKYKFGTSNSTFLQRHMQD